MFKENKELIYHPLNVLPITDNTFQYISSPVRLVTFPFETSALRTLPPPHLPLYQKYRSIPEEDEYEDTLFENSDEDSLSEYSPSIESENSYSETEVNEQYVRKEPKIRRLIKGYFSKRAVKWKSKLKSVLEPPVYINADETSEANEDQDQERNNNLSEIISKPLLANNTDFIYNSTTDMVTLAGNEPNTKHSDHDYFNNHQPIIEINGNGTRRVVWAKTPPSSGGTQLSPPIRSPIPHSLFTNLPAKPILKSRTNRNKDIEYQRAEQASNETPLIPKRYNRI